jgi:hypothetical protein
MNHSAECTCEESLCETYEDFPRNIPIASSIRHL